MTALFNLPVESEMGVSFRDASPIHSGGISVAFGDCAGMFHPAASSEAVLILPPFGHEALASARTLRLLADRLASAGYPVLRLDAHGVGDAPGDEAELDLMESRAKSLMQARAWLLDVAGVSRVSVIALRLVASIALLQAQALACHRLMLVAPVASGRSYLRELKQMQRLYSQDHGLGDGAAQEFNGFRLSDASVAALSAMDIRKVADVAAHRIALMAEGDTPVVKALHENWRASGRSVDVIDYRDIDRLLSDPATSGPATDMVDEVANWFGAPQDHCGAFWTPPGHALVKTREWTEQGHRFGANERLYGVLCRPAAPRADAPAIIIVNTGGNSHIGWGRQTVELARELAAHGVTSLRMDIAGVGESCEPPQARKRVVYVADAGADVVEAVRFIEAQGFRKPALLGVCSGAFLVFHALRMNPSVAGALMINLQKFYWQEGEAMVLYNSVGSYAAKLFSRESLSRALRGEADVRGVAKIVLKRGWTMAKTRVGSLFSPLFRKAGATSGASQASPASVIAAACDAGARVTMAFTTGDGGIDEMRSHLGAHGKALRRKAGFNVEMIPVADHNFSSTRSRRRLAPLVLNFASQIAGVRQATPNEAK